VRGPWRSRCQLQLEAQAARDLQCPTELRGGLAALELGEEAYAYMA